MSDEVTFSGPWFDGRADAVIKDYLQWAKETGAKHGVDLVRNTLHARLKHPTGYYESQTEAIPDGDDWQVTNGVIYSAWLEGVGSRNAPVTRFVGYHSFRDASLELDDSIVSVIDPIPERFMKELNG